MIDISEGVNLFNDWRFFEAHDYFEDIWLDYCGEARMFFQGLIQISVGYFHLINNNFRGSYNQLSKGSTKLQNYSPAYFQVDVEQLIKEFEPFIEKLEKKISGMEVEINTDTIPRLKYKTNKAK
ncbi:MAG: DUF309 domain-containing protein [Melioribacteraceae bacterium]|nr:DUF309 domain-containing protein [Melioribacteraceae bacterium]MCF8356575.1 DUF309 domain-containing protein [Melioribacteraceae bacterium]MCF8395986.1 DUF309 domain-containing protein [Melioribacteraceae bacterium]MCF8421037.1 DUF309 domain-containing protein [Melioribacteraceae bacterium]